MEIKYYIVSSMPTSDLEVDIYNSAYSCFKSVWGKFFTTAQMAEAFKRHKYISCIVVDDEVVALCCYDTFRLELLAHSQHSYFSDYPEDFMTFTAENNINTVLTFESLTVAREYRGIINGIRISDLLTQLSFKVSEFMEADYIFAPVIRDNKANLLGINAGTKVLAEDVNYKGFNCDLLAHKLGEKVLVKDINTKRALNLAWENRLDLTGLTHQQRVESQKPEAA